MGGMNAILQGLADKYNTTKRHHKSYIPAYEQLLASRRHTIRTVLEMGIGDGSSLKMWRDWFPQAHIWGLDTGEDCYRHSEERISVVIGDQGNVIALDQLIGRSGRFDLIIDDAGHDVQKQQIALRFLWSHLKPGGCFIMEDTESSYWKHSGGFRNPATTIEFLKRALDGINLFYAQNETKLPPEQIVELPGLASAHWFANICFLFKE